MEGIDQVALDLGLDDAVGDAHWQQVAVDLLGRLIECNGGDDNSFVLRNEAYAGTLVWNKYSKSFGRRQKRDASEVIRVPDCHESLVDKDVFAMVQALLTSRRPPRSTPRLSRANIS